MIYFMITGIRIFLSPGTRQDIVLHLIMWPEMCWVLLWLILIFRARAMFNSLTRGVACPDLSHNHSQITYLRLATVPSLGRQLNTERYWFIKLGMIYQFKTSQVCPPAQGDISPVRQQFKLQRKFMTFKGQGFIRCFLLYRVSVYQRPWPVSGQLFSGNQPEKYCTAKNHKKKLEANMLVVRCWFKRMESEE